MNDMGFNKRAAAANLSLESEESFRNSLIAISEAGHNCKSSNDNNNHYKFLGEPQSRNYIHIGAIASSTIHTIFQVNCSAGPLLQI